MNSFELTRTTPFPNELFKAMARLRDTEWRVMCVVIRFTVGFTDPYSKGRKLRAGISHNQFKRWTGREGAAISNAIDVLVQSGLLLVCDYNGQRLGTKAERRRAQSLLIYGVDPNVLR
ncbi:MAG TPA: hypothetical protein VGL56_18050 [Fimbriimonadaceae bacterium]|jgi:hypothetical protein